MRGAIQIIRNEELHDVVLLRDPKLAQERRISSSSGFGREALRFLGAAVLHLHAEDAAPVLQLSRSQRRAYTIRVAIVSCNAMRKASALPGLVLLLAGEPPAPWAWRLVLRNNQALRFVDTLGMLHPLALQLSQRKPRWRSVRQALRGCSWARLSDPSSAPLLAMAWRLVSPRSSLSPLR